MVRKRSSGVDLGEEEEMMNLRRKTSRWDCVGGCNDKVRVDELGCREGTLVQR